MNGRLRAVQACQILFCRASRRIKDKAFIHIAAKRVKLPEGLSSIGSRAFADCSALESIFIPDSCTIIAEDAFSGVTGLEIFGKEGSYAEIFSGNNGFLFVNVE